MLSEGRGYLRDAWWISTFPGLAIMLTVLAINLLGDGLRDALDPRLKVGGDRSGHSSAGYRQRIAAPESPATRERGPGGEVSQ